MNLLSVVIPVYNEAEGLDLLTKNLQKVFGSFPIQTEWVFINDGSKDDSLKILCDLQKNEPRIKIISFTKNYGQETAVTAGIELSQGDCVAIIDADLQDPPELLLPMYEQLLKGNDVVYGERTSRAGETWFKIQSANFFYGIMNRFGINNLPKNVGNFRIMKRDVCEAMSQYREYNQFNRVTGFDVGFKQSAFYYERASRTVGTSSYSKMKMIKNGISIFISYSYFPLRIMVLTSGVLAVLSLFAPALSNLQSLTQVFLMGLLCEYVIQSHRESKKRPNYIVQKIIGFKTKVGTTASGGYILQSACDSNTEQKIKRVA